MSSAEFEAMMHAAWRRTVKMTALEREAGFASPENGPLDIGLRTVKDALECGVKMRDWEPVCEGLALLHALLVANGWWKVDDWAQKEWKAKAGS